MAGGITACGEIVKVPTTPNSQRQFAGTRDYFSMHFGHINSELLGFEEPWVLIPFGTTVKIPASSLGMLMVCRFETEKD